MRFDLIALAVPFFVLFMVLEFVIAKRKNLPYFNLHNSIANISIGIAERLLDAMVTGLFFFVYSFIHDNYGIFDIKASPWLWVALLLITDLVWYWYHRFAHEVNLFWAVHIVHHQSEDFNYTVSARITVLQAIVRTGFWSVLPLIGFPPQMIITMLLIHGLYPFFIHTRVIGKLGVLEHILVTPSHHRVHHASNEKYLDKNYGDVFIIWDKLFGTFQKEEEEPKYGLTRPLQSYSFLWQHFHYFIEMYLAMKKATGIWNKFKIIFSRPDTLSESNRTTAEAIFLVKKSDIPVEKRLNRYVVWQIGITITVLFFFVLMRHQLTPWATVAVALFIVLTLVNCGAIMEQKRWIFYLEFGRIFLGASALLFKYPNSWLLFFITITGTLLLYYFNTLKEYYFRIVYRKND